MKTQQLIFFFVLYVFPKAFFAQSNTYPYPNIGDVGIGIPQANFNVQIHGTTDYITSPPIPNKPHQLKELVTNNHGKTARLGLTNTITGSAKTDGLLIRMSELNAYITNQENKNIQISSGGANLLLSGNDNRIWFSKSTSSNMEYAYVNINSSDNGLYVIPGYNKYGLTVQPWTKTDRAIQVIGNGEQDRNFVVLGNGYVYARKYTTTLNNIPDYVFQPNYSLMSLSELKRFVFTNFHLPKVPSACEYEGQDVDLGEMNRLLLEKVEENVLYIFQLEERLEKMEKLLGELIDKAIPKN